MMVAWCLFDPVGGVGDGMGGEGNNAVAVVFVKEVISALVEFRGGFYLDTVVRTIQIQSFGRSGYGRIWRQ
jgi:hypothetical protein